MIPSLSLIVTNELLSVIWAGTLSESDPAMVNVKVSFSSNVESSIDEIEIVLEVSPAANEIVWLIEE